MRSGIGERNRALLERLHRAAGGPFTARDAATVLTLDVARTRRLLSWLQSQGWLARVRRGLYSTVPLGATAPSEWREDAWVVAQKIFSPCYIGGWSACEHWSLTEQIFRGVVVVTSRAVRSSRLEVQGTTFRARRVKASHLFGTQAVWRGRVKVRVSDPSRTVVDILDDPSIGGGIRHAAGVLREYFAGEHRNDSLLLDYAARVGNRSVFKRLGHLVETLAIHAPDVRARCREARSAGLTLLDPSVKSRGTISKRWNLYVNVPLAAKESAA